MFCIIFDTLGLYGPYIDIVSIWNLNLKSKKHLNSLQRLKICKNMRKFGEIAKIYMAKK